MLTHQCVLEEALRYGRRSMSGILSWRWHRNGAQENGVRDVSLWREMLGVEKAVLDRVEFDELEQVLVAHVRPLKRERGQWGHRLRIALRG